MFEELTAWENLLLAYRNASRGKRRQPNVAAFEHRLEDNLAKLRSELRQRTYVPGPYDTFPIHEPKRRLISAAPFRDRVVHHALCNVTEPLFEPGFIWDTFANRRGKGTHRALDRCQELARRYAYVLQLDVRQFFPSIDHAVLRGILAAKVDDLAVLWLIDTILASGREVHRDAYEMVYFPGDDLFAINRPRGLPLGNLTSQFWGNVYLSPLDHFVKRELRCPGYVRYVDDLLLFAPAKDRLWEAKEAIEERLLRFRLSFHRGGHPRPVTGGVPFLGFVIYPDRRRLKRRKGIQFRRRLREAVGAYRAGNASLGGLKSTVDGWLNHVRYANSTGLQKVVLADPELQGILEASRPRSPKCLSEPASPERAPPEVCQPPSLGQAIRRRSSQSRDSREGCADVGPRYAARQWRDLPAGVALAPNFARCGR